MKSIYFLITAFVIVIVSAVSFSMGRQYEEQYYGDNSLEIEQLKDSCQKHYEAACLQADFIRHAIDHFNGETECWNIGAEIEDSYYEWFQELDSNFNTEYIKDVRQFGQYSWCY